MKEFELDNDIMEAYLSGERFAKAAIGEANVNQVARIKDFFIKSIQDNSYDRFHSTFSLLSSVVGMKAPQYLFNEDGKITAHHRNFTTGFDIAIKDHK